MQSSFDLCRTPTTAPPPPPTNKPSAAKTHSLNDGATEFRKGSSVLHGYAVEGTDELRTDPSTVTVYPLSPYHSVFGTESWQKTV